MSVQLSGSVIAAIYAQGDTPDTPEEWIIAALNLGGVAATGDIKADGSVPFTGQETFGAGLKTDNIVEKTVGLGVTVNSNVGIGGVSAGSSTILGLAAATASMAQITMAASGAVVVSSPNSGDVYYSNTGFNFYDGTTLMSLLTNSGWTLPIGTASKAGFDSDGAGFANADQIALAQTVKAIMDHLMTNMKLFTA